MDGLLVDSERLEWRVWREAAVEHRIDLTDERFFSFIGHSAEEGERLLREYFGAEFDVPGFRASCRTRMRALVDAEGVALRPGAREWIEFVTGLGIPVAVATSSGPVHARERLGDLWSHFAKVVTRADVERGKPFPDLYLEAARRLNVRPDACLALEDSPTGARAALAAGMPVLIVPDLVTPPEELAALATGVYESLHHVRDAAHRAWGEERP
ncbi:MAG: HAD family phosphatase [Gemmatimonadaceae bacterium]|nr:HAD family phosphatase [Gemmatimonadaceae bacterium]NUQ92086.1 HAD family phosphatase [Gemmatimonadaceae bacterium]NUR33990.1 HAD family phosphatase [Gemmatimonadaceae bacterium]NUS96178.1 HAD family phosphatase [Gemmatimonadaceae bacterium]